MAGLLRSRPILLLLLIAPAVAAPARLADQAHEMDAWWLEPAADVTLDPTSGRINPARPGVAAAITYSFRATAARPALSLSYDSHLGGPGDWIRVEAGTDSATLSEVAEQTWRAGRQQLALSQLLPAGQPLLVRLSLHAHERVDRVWIANLTWETENVSRVAADAPRLPRSAWLYPAWAARTTQRAAAGLPPGAAVTRGRGRLVGPAPAVWTAGSGLLRASWLAIPEQPGRIRQLVIATGAAGGRLRLDGVAVAAHRLPWMPLGARLPARGPWPATEVEGADPRRPAEVIQTGRLELRHVRPRWDGRALWLDLTVVNHGSQDVVGSLQGTLDGEHQAAGYRFPPGGALARLAFVPVSPRLWESRRPAVYQAEVLLAEGAAVSDARHVSVGLKEVEFGSSGWRLNGRGLEVMEVVDAAGVAAARPGTAVAVSVAAAPLLLDEAERLGVPVVIQAPDPLTELAAEMLYAGRPAVLGVIRR